MPKRYGKHAPSEPNRAERPSDALLPQSAPSVRERTAGRVSLALRTMETKHMPSWEESVLDAATGVNTGWENDSSVGRDSSGIAATHAESLDWRAEKRVYLLRHYPYKNDEVFQEYDHLWQKKNRWSGLRGKEKLRYDELHAKLSNAQVLEDLPPRHQDAIAAIFSRPERTLFVYDAVTGPKRNRETAEDLLKRFTVPSSQIVSDVPLPQSNAESFLEKQTEMNGKLLESYERIRARITEDIDTVVILGNRSYALSFDHWAENKSTSPKQSMDRFEERGYAFYDLDASGSVLPQNGNEPTILPEDFAAIRSVVDPLLPSSPASVLPIMHPVSYAKIVTSYLRGTIAESRDSDHPLLRAVCYDPVVSKVFRPWLVQTCIDRRNSVVLERFFPDGIPSIVQSEALLLLRIFHQADSSDAPIVAWAGRCLFRAWNAHSSALSVESAFRSLSGELGTKDYREKLESYQKTLRLQSYATLKAAGDRPMARRANVFLSESSTDAAFRRSFGSNALFSRTVSSKGVRQQPFCLSEALAEPSGKYLISASVGEGKSFFLAASVRECLESDACGLPVHLMEGKDFAGWSETQVAEFFLDAQKSSARLFVDAIDEIPNSTIRQAVKRALMACPNWCMVASRMSEYPEIGKSDAEAYGFRIVRLEALSAEAYIDTYSTEESGKKQITELLDRLGSAPGIRDNPLVLSFLLRLSSAPPKRIWENRERGIRSLGEIDSVTELYESVMRLIIAGYEEGKWVRAVTFDRDFLDGAMDFLADFAYEISKGHNFAEMKQRHRYLGKEYLEWLNALFRVEWKDEYRFSHESVYEFFLARYHVRNASAGIPEVLRPKGAEWTEWRSRFPLARAYGNLLVDGGHWETLDEYFSKRGLLAGDSALGENLFQAYGVFLSWERRMDRMGRICSPEEEKAYSRIRQRFMQMANKANQAQLTLWFESYRVCMADSGRIQDTVFTPKYLEFLSEMPEKSWKGGMLESLYRLMSFRTSDYHESDEIRAVSKKYYSPEFLERFGREDRTWHRVLEDLFLSEDGGWAFASDRKILEEELYSILPTDSLQALLLSAFQSDWDPSASFFARISQRTDIATETFFARLGQFEWVGEFLARWHGAIRGPIRSSIEAWVVDACPDGERLAFVREVAYRRENRTFVLECVQARLAGSLSGAAMRRMLEETLGILSRIPGYSLSENEDWLQLAATYLEKETLPKNGFALLSHLGDFIQRRGTKAADYAAYQSLFRKWLLRLGQLGISNSPEVRSALRSYDGKDAFEHRHFLQETLMHTSDKRSVRDLSEWFYRSGYLERLPGPLAFVWHGYSPEKNRETFGRVSSMLFELLEMSPADSAGMVDRAGFALHLVRICIKLAELDAGDADIPAYSPQEWQFFFHRLEEGLLASQGLSVGKAFDIATACHVEESNLLALGLLSRSPDAVLRNAYEVRWEGYPSFNESTAPRVLSLLARSFPNREYASAEAFSLAHPHLRGKLDAIAREDVRLRRSYESSTKSEMRFLTMGKDRIRKELLVSLFREHARHGHGSDDLFRIARKMSEQPFRIAPFSMDD